MPSQAFLFWQSDRSARLNELEAAHAAIGGTSRGRRYVTEQINHSYAVLLASQFQGYCRDLHSESVDHLVAGISLTIQRRTVQQNFEYGRALDRGNANAATIGKDFGRLMPGGQRFWDAVDLADVKSRDRRQRLDHLILWRNAIAHQDFTVVGLNYLRKTTVREWRRICTALAKTFDRVMREQVWIITGTSPWI